MCIEIQFKLFNMFKQNIVLEIKMSAFKMKKSNIFIKQKNDEKFLCKVKKIYKKKTY